MTELEALLSSICTLSQDGGRWVGAAKADFLAGDAFASGALERRDRFWLQASTQS